MQSITRPISPVGQPSNRPIAILVVGMHRSGTSAFTRILNIMGAALPADLMPANEFNAPGYWEPKDLYKVHEAILGSVGLTWDHCGSVPESLFKSVVTPTYVEKIKEFLTAEFSSTPLFVVKDPRVCRIIPLWLSALADFGAEPRFLIPVRHPMEIAESLKKRDKIITERSLLLWLRHFLDAEFHTRGFRRSFVSYSDLLVDWRRTVNKIGRDLDVVLPNSSHGAVAEIEAFLSGQHRHHVITQPLEARPEVVSWVSEAFAWALKATGSKKAPPEVIDRIRQDLDRADLAYGPLLADQQVRLVKKESEFKNLEEELLKQKDNLVVEIGKRDLEIQRLDRLIVDGEIIIIRLNQLIADKHKEIDRLTAEMTAADRRLQEADNQVGASQAEIERLQSEVTVRNQEIQRLDRAVADGEIIITRLNHLIADKQAEGDRLAVELQSAEDHVEHLRNLIETGKQAIEHLQGEIMARDQEIRRLDTVVVDSDDKIKHLDTVIFESRSEVERFKLEMTVRDKEIQRLDQIVVARDNQDEHLYTLTRQLRDLETELVRLTTQVKRVTGSLGWKITKPLRMLMAAIHYLLILPRRSYRIIAASGLFDADYYLTHNPDLTGSPTVLLGHYLKHGWREGRDPNPLFDTSFYLEQYPDVARAGINPLAHFLAHGHREGRDPHPFFDTSFYLEQNPDVAQAGMNPLAHYRSIGAAENRSTRPSLVQAGHHSGSFEAGREFFTQFPGYSKKFLDQPLQERYLDDWDELLRQVNSGHYKELPPNPDISIITVSDSNWRHVLLCLDSLKRQASRYRFEIIVVDQGSDIFTATVLSQVMGIRYIRLEPGQRRESAWPVGIEAAKGRQIVLLKSDTCVLPGWLDQLADTFQTIPDAGLVGSQILHPNGRLKEAGGIVWRDGTVSVCGRDQDRHHPAFNYQRRVGYVSATSVMINKEHLGRIGGWQGSYGVTGYGEANLAMKLKKLGRHAVYQPLSRVVHFGQDTLGYGGSCLPENWPAQFIDHLSEFLDRYPQPGIDLNLARDWPISARMLIIDACTPTPDQDSGSLDVYNFIRIFLSMGYKITFIPESNFQYFDHYTDDLQRHGVECLYAPFTTTVEAHLEEFGRYYDVVFLYRITNGGKYIDVVRKQCPQARVFFDTVDLHYLRQLREAELAGSDRKLQEALALKNVELEVIKRSDCTIVLSSYECEEIRRELPQPKLAVIPLVRDIPGRLAPFEGRKDICFVGGFQHPPNADAVKYFVSSIWPQLKKMNSQLKFYVVGSKPTPELYDLAADDIIITGFVEDLGPYFNTCRLSIAPLRYGAGLKGKVATSLGYGLPCVATGVAVEGSGLQHRVQVLVADTPDEFAESVAELYNNPQLWYTLSDNGLGFVRKEYSLEANAGRLAKLFCDFQLPPFHVPCPICGAVGQYQVENQVVPCRIICQKCGSVNKQRLKT